MNDRPKTCKECKFYFDCRKSSIANAYGGLECAEKWHKNPVKMNDDKLREAFEAIYTGMDHSKDHNGEYIRERTRSDFYTYKAGVESTQPENEQLKYELKCTQEAIAEQAKYRKIDSEKLAVMREALEKVEAENKKLREIIECKDILLIAYRTGSRKGVEKALDRLQSLKDGE